MSIANVLESDATISAEIREPNGQRSVLLEQLRGSATTAELKARAQSELRLEAEVDWNLRDDRTGRILRDDQRVGEFADRLEPRVRLTMQPDAGLG
jgi:hypothetical protein